MCRPHAAHRKPASVHGFALLVWKVTSSLIYPFLGDEPVCCREHTKGVKLCPVSFVRCYLSMSIVPHFRWSNRHNVGLLVLGLNWSDCTEFSWKLCDLSWTWGGLKCAFLHTCVLLLCAGFSFWGDIRDLWCVLKLLFLRKAVSDLPAPLRERNTLSAAMNSCLFDNLSILEFPIR